MFVTPGHSAVQKVASCGHPVVHLVSTPGHYSVVESSGPHYVVESSGHLVEVLSDLLEVVTDVHSAAALNEV